MPPVLDTIPARPTDGRILAGDLHRGGYGEDLVSVIPPVGKLSPNSKIKPESMGKAPGRLNAVDEWAGAASWNDHRTTRAEAQEMDDTGASVGLRAEVFPAFDVDVTHPKAAKIIEDVIRQRFPSVAQRVGAAPKALFPFRLAAGAAPFKKMVLAFIFAGDRFKVEVLGDGQQYVISGIHPKTKRPYQWPQGCPTADSLPEIDGEKANELLEEIRKALEAAGADCEPVSGVGARADRSDINQDSLKADDLGLLRRAVEAIPNRQEDRREFYVQMCIAIKAAGADLDMWMNWAAKWEGGNDPEYDLRTWEDLHPPFEIGAEWIYSEARKHGFDNAAEEFTTIPGATAPESGTSATVPNRDRSLIPLMGPDHFNDDGNAERFVQLYGQDAKYCKKRKCWFVWDGRRWQRDEGSKVEGWAVDAMREFLKQAAGHADHRERLLKFAVESLNVRRIKSLLEMAEGKLGIAADKFDTNPYLLNFENGTLDVRTGSLTPHDRRHLITRIVHCNYNPAAKCPRFLDLLAWVMEGAPEMVGYLQRAFGYSLTGSTQDKVFFVCHGPSNTGKTTVLRTVMRTFKEYSTAIQMESLTQRPGFESSNAQSDLADLNGTRFALTSETEKGLHFNEALIKRITQGGGRIKYARKYENPVEFEETHKLWFDANHMPVVKDGTGLFERLRQIPFNNVVTDDRRDNGLGEKLAAEVEGIAAWVAAGAIEWAARGSLSEPEQVKRAGAEYKRSQDSVEGWARTCLVLGPEGRATFRELQESYEAYCQRMHRTPIDPHLLPDQLRRRGLSNTKVGGQRGWRGASIGGGEFDVVEDGE